MNIIDMKCAMQCPTTKYQLKGFTTGTGNIAKNVVSNINAISSAQNQLFGIWLQCVGIILMLYKDTTRMNPHLRYDSNVI